MFDSPAAILVVLSSTWFLVVPKSTPMDRKSMTVSYMTDTKNYGRYGSFSIKKDNSLIDVSLQAAPMKFLGLRLGVSGMYGAQGTYMIGPGIGKTVDIGKFDATLFIYPSYSSVRGLDRNVASGNMNWRTTLDFTYRSNRKINAGIGLLHISNGGYQEPNHGIEAVRVMLEYDFQ